MLALISVKELNEVCHRDNKVSLKSLTMRANVKI